MIEKQIGKKIKLLQIDNIGEYKDRFLQFGQNNRIDIHFTIGKHGVTKEMNCSLLENVRCLLSNAQLDKSFWAEALKYASNLMNRLSSTVIGGKTPLNIWSDRAAQDYNLLGCLDVRPTSMSKMTSSICKQKSLCFRVPREIGRLQGMEPRKQEDYIEQACHI